MKQPTEMGMNRTGLGMAPRLKDEMIKGAESAHPPKKDGYANIDELRRDYSRSAPAVGSIPPPSSAKGFLKTGMEALKGHDPTVFLDKLGERLAFERTGTRLYEAMLVKYDSEGSWPGGPTGDELRDFHNEERAHFLMLRDAIESLGGDPSTVTPSADISGVASEGVMKVVTDPRSSLSESLEALLIAELVDHDGWEMLIHLADGMGQKDLASKFRSALAEEDTHLKKVREWLMKDMEQHAGSS